MESAMLQLTLENEEYKLLFMNEFSFVLDTTIIIDGQKRKEGLPSLNI